MKLKVTLITTAIVTPVVLGGIVMATLKSHSANISAALAESIQNTFADKEDNVLHYRRISLTAQTSVDTSGPIQVNNVGPRELKVWSYGNNLRFDGQMMPMIGSMLFLAKDKQSCRALGGKYHCETTAMPDMLPFATPTITEDLFPRVVQDSTTDNVLALQWKTQKPIHTGDNVAISSNDTGYVDGGIAVRNEPTSPVMFVNRQDGDHYTHSTDFALVNNNDVNNNPEYDARPDTVQFQIKLDEHYSSVYEYNKRTQQLRVIPATELAGILQQSEYKYQARIKQQPNMADALLKDLFSLPSVMQADGKIVQQPLEQDTVQRNGQKLVRVRYRLPDNTTIQYAEFVFDPIKHRVIEYTALDANKQVLRQVKLEEDRILTELDPVTFFTKEAWVNELHLQAGTLTPPEINLPD